MLLKQQLYRNSACAFHCPNFFIHITFIAQTFLVVRYATVVTLQKLNQRHVT